MNYPGPWGGVSALQKPNCLTPQAAGNRTLLRFKVATEQMKWGRPGFAYTPRVAYEHKVYEFKIPFAAIGMSHPPKPGTRLDLAFAAYGTFTPAIVYSSSETATQNGVMPDQGPSGACPTNPLACLGRVG
jgi:hypothetical protein